MSETKATPGNGMLLFLLGAVLGAVAVALLTPKSGPELRADLKAKARDLQAEFDDPLDVS